MRRTLTVLVIATTTAVVVALVVPLALLVGRLAHDRAVSAATQQAQSVALLVATQPANAPLTQLESVLSLNDQRTGLRTSVVPASGATIGPAVPSADLARARQGQSFTQLEGQAPDGAAVYVPVAVENGGNSVVRVGVSNAALTDGVARARILLLALAFGLVVVSVVAAVVLARRVSAPLVRVAGVAHELRQGRLQRRVVPAGPPEVREVGSALNQLAGRIGELLQAEREAAADLSHRLRTPVTALRLAVDTTPDPVERERLREHLDRLESTVDAIVRQARRPATSDGDRDGPVRADLAAIVRERTEFWGALAEDQHRRLDVAVEPGELVVPVDPQDLVDVVDVLLDNVFAHTEPGVGLSVRVGGVADGVELEVQDDGPGLPGADVVGRGRSGAGSTGLGLSIVARVAEVSGARLELGSAPSGGARVSLRWPQWDR